MVGSRLGMRAAIAGLFVCASVLVPGPAGAAPPAGPRWGAFYDGPRSGLDLANAMAVSPDGSRVYVTGSSHGTKTSNSDYATVAYDAASGRQVWVARYNGPGNGNDFAGGLAVSPDGARVFVTGYSFDLSTSYDYAREGVGLLRSN